MESEEEEEEESDFKEMLLFLIGFKFEADKNKTTSIPEFLFLLSEQMTREDVSPAFVS